MHVSRMYIKYSKVTVINLMITDQSLENRIKQYSQIFINKYHNNLFLFIYLQTSIFSENFTEPLTGYIHNTVECCSNGESDIFSLDWGHFHM